jgi:hypothetical protein
MHLMLGAKKFASGLTFVVALFQAKTFHGLRLTPSGRLGTVTMYREGQVEVRREECRRLHFIAATTP